MTDTTKQAPAMTGRNIATVNRSLGAWLRSSSGGGFVEEELNERLEHVHRQVAWVYAAVRMIATSMRRGRLVFRRGPDADAEPIDRSPIVDLFRRPNPTLSAQRFLEGLAFELTIRGEAPFLMTNRGGEPVEARGSSSGGDPAFDATIPVPEHLWPLHGGERASLTLHQDTNLPHLWRFGEVSKGQAKARQRPAHAVLMFRHYDPDRAFRGLAPMTPIIGVAASLFLADVLNRKQLSRGGEKSHALVYDRVLDPDVFDRLRQEIQETWDDAAESGRTRLIHGGAKLQSLGATARDMAYAGLGQVARKDISAAIGVSDAVLGMGASNYATFEGERRVFWETTILTLQDLVADEINMLLMRIDPRTIGGEHFAYFDNTAVPAMQGDLGIQAEAARKLMAVGVPRAVALKRAGIDGLDEFEDDDVALLEGSWARYEDVVGGVLPEPPQDDEPEEEPEPEPDPEPEPEEPEGEDDEDADNRGLAPAVERAVGAPSDEPAVEVTREAQPVPEPVSDREDWWAARERRREDGDIRITRAVRRVWRGTRRDQLAHLRAIANGERQRSVARLYPDDPALDSFTDRSLDGLVRAIDADRLASRAALRRGLDDPCEHREVSCSGEILFREQLGYGPAARNWWAGQSAALQGVPGGLQRMVDRAVLRAANVPLTEAEIDSLVIANERAYSEALAELLTPIYQSIAADMAGVVADELGLPVLDLTDPRALRQFADTALVLAQDVNGTLAARVRSAIVRALADGEQTVGSLREVVAASLTDLERATTDEFIKANRRALTIARTETAGMDNGATFRAHEQYRAQGAMATHDWVAASRSSPPVGRTRPSHVAVDGTYVPIGQAWRVGPALLRYPGEKGVGYPSETVNCRCALRGRRLAADLQDGRIDQETYDALTGQGDD